MFGFRALSFWLWTDAGGEPEPEPAPAAASSGGYFVRTRTQKDIDEGRRKLGILPPEEEVKAEEAIAAAVEAASQLSRAKAESQAATDALQAQARAEALFLAVYRAVYPQLVEAQILEAFRLEAQRRAQELEEEAFVILLMSAL